jgi:hypothetical protein
VPSVTHITFPEAEQRQLRQAVEYYRFKSLNAFLRFACAAIIDHYRRNDELRWPIAFQTNHDREKSDDGLRSG